MMLGMVTNIFEEKSFLSNFLRDAQPKTFLSNGAKNHCSHRQQKRKKSQFTPHHIKYFHCGTFPPNESYLQLMIVDGCSHEEHTNLHFMQPYKFLSLVFDVKVMVLEQLSARQSKTKNGQTSYRCSFLMLSFCNLVGS